MKIKPEMFGDATIFPVINSIVNIFNNSIESGHYNNNEFKYCSNLVREYNEKMNYLNVLDKPIRKYFMVLMKKDFLDRLKRSKLTENIYTHMCNLIIGIHRNKIQTFRL